MAYSLKEQLNKKPRLASGHRLCAGCGAGVAINSVLRALDEGDRAVVSNATSCLEVSTFIYPNTAYEDSYVHSAFENAAAMTASAETAEHMTSVCSHSPALWREATIWFTSVTITRLT